MSRVSRLRGPGGPELFCLPRETRTIAPGAVHVPDWLSLEEQIELVRLCREWSRGEHRMRHQVMAGGGVMSVQSTVLGATWGRPWSPTAAEATGQRLPSELAELGRRGIADAYGEDAAETASFEPTTALINYYDASARMGQHQDLDESGPEPIISVSLGDSCLFRMGNPQSRGQPYQDIELRSGDLFVFGRASRWAFHGVPAIRPGTGDPRLGMRGGGRLNITLRSTQPGAPGRGRPSTGRIASGDGRAPAE